MKKITPKNIALFSALVIFLGISFSLFVIEWLFYDVWHWKTIVITAFIVFPVTYFVVKYSITRLIYDKLRLIFKTILSLKTSRSLSQKYLDEKEDIISSVNQHVLKWAEDKSKEIDELKKLEAYRREFLGNVSHELKTPIFNIQGYVLTLLDGGLEDPTINREYLLRTEKSIERMISIVEDLIAISKLESGELKLEYSRFDIVALTKEVFESLEIISKAKNIKLSISQKNDKPIFVYADKDAIRQVLTNLIDNSIKYSDENGRTKVSFFDLMDEHILVEVTDRGIGIAQDQIPRVFERFYRTDKSRSREQGGSGLGLSIVKHIIEAHQQTINVRSTLGVGSTFAFTLKAAN